MKPQFGAIVYIDLDPSRLYYADLYQVAGAAVIEILGPLGESVAQPTHQIRTQPDSGVNLEPDIVVVPVNQVKELRPSKLGPEPEKKLRGPGR